MSLKEYVVTLKNQEDLDKFYHDMENLGGPRFIPNRPISCTLRRPISRSTHYRISDSEAELIKKDPRVLGVELPFEAENLKIRPHRLITSSFWNKSFSVSSNHLNWGILRCIEGQQRSNWGSNGTTNVTGTVTLTSTGRNVDVVIVDGLINPAHPEFAVNADGTGGSRIIQYNWFQHNPTVTGGAAGTYVYTPYVDPGYPDENGDGISDRTDDNNHGAHVAGTACGNKYGWASSANIYNISPYASAPSYTSLFIDYIRAWHSSKPINPLTGRKNPTVTNHSYGITAVYPASWVTQIGYRGTVYNGPFDASQFASYGIDTYTDEGTLYIFYPSRWTNAATEAAYMDAMDEGIIFVGSAGNDNYTIAEYSEDPSADYNNYIYFGGFATTRYYMRGSISAPTRFICVGAVGVLTNDSKATYSNSGPGVDIYAPGNAINSAVNSSDGVTVADSRNTTYRLTKYSGTSMAGPQVAGVLACLAEVWPRMTQDQAKEYIQRFAKVNQMFDSGGGYFDDFSLQGSPNRYLHYVQERPLQGQVSPKINQGLRANSGNVWPRTKIYRYGR